MVSISRRHDQAFTLVEVAIALGVFATTLVVVLGLLSQLSRSIANVRDYDKAAALGDAIQTELVRLRDAGPAGNKLSAFIQNVVPAGQPLRLYATANGSRVVADYRSAADSNLAGTDATQPRGIPKRDRYYLIELSQQADAVRLTDANFVVLNAKVTWPYRLPLGPKPAAPTLGTIGVDYKIADATQAAWLFLDFAVSP